MRQLCSINSATSSRLRRVRNVPLHHTAINFSAKRERRRVDEAEYLLAYTALLLAPGLFRAGITPVANDQRRSPRKLRSGLRAVGTCSALTSGRTHTICGKVVGKGKQGFVGSWLRTVLGK